MEKVLLRVASLEDAAALREIYRPYVERTAVTFEYDVPSEEEFRRRMAAILPRYPYLVAEQGGRPLGYAYAASFKSRRATTGPSRFPSTWSGRAAAAAWDGGCTRRWRTSCGSRES